MGARAGAIGLGGGFGAASGAISGAISGSIYPGVGTLIGAAVGALAGLVVGAGSAALAYKEPPKPQNSHSDMVETRMVRNLPVPVVCGRGRLGGTWIAVGYFDAVKDFAANVPKGTIDYIANGVLSLCEGPIQSYGNVRLDGQTLVHWQQLENLPYQFLQFEPHYGTATEALFAAQSVHENGFINITPNPVPWRNTSTMRCLVYTGPQNTPRLPDVNIDVVGPELTIKRSGTTTDNANGDVPLDCFYDGYSEQYAYTLSSSNDGSPFGIVTIGRRGGHRVHTQPPTGVSSVTKTWYLGRHDVVVMQDPSDSARFFLGYPGISPTSSSWRTQYPSTDYSNAILLSCLDERHGLLHTLHDSGTKRYILRWNLLTGRIDRLDTDLPAATWKAMTFSPDLGAYVIASSTSLMVVSSSGETIRNTTNPSTASCLGVYVSGQQVGVVNSGSAYTYDFYTGAVAGPFGANNTTYTETGALGLIASARQNTWTGHVTITKPDGSGNTALINFIPSCVENKLDIDANGTSGLGTQAFSSVNKTGSPELDFQDPGNLYTGAEQYHPKIYTGTGNVVGSTHYPPDDNTQDWVRDWSWRTFNAWNLVSLQGNSSLAAAMWNFLVDEPNTDSARWGGGLNNEFFSLSSFESLHSYCVGPITVINPNGIDTRVCERFKFDHVLDSETDLASHVTQNILVCCQGFHYTMGGILYVDVPRSGLWPLHHFSDRQISENSTSVNFISRADGVNRVRVVYKDVLDEYRRNYGEAEDLADINARGHVQSVEINADGAGRFASAQLIAKQVLDQSTAGRRQVSFKTNFLGLMMSPGDPIEISSVQCGLNRMPARVIVVREDASGGPAGEVEIQALETHSTLDSLDDIPASYAAPGDGISLIDGSTAFNFTAYPASDLDDTDGGGIAKGSRITWIQNANVFAATTYQITYQSGAYSLASKLPHYKYVVAGVNGGWAAPPWVVTKAPDGTLIKLSNCPGVLENSPWATYAAAQQANAGQFTTFNLTQPGPIGVQMQPDSDSCPGIDQPSGAAISQGGATGTTTYSYRITALDSNSNETASTEVSTAAGNATLSATNYNIVTWTAVTGASSYNVYGRTLDAEMLMRNVSTNSYNDTGADIPSTTQGAPLDDNTAINGIVYQLAST